LTIVFVDLPDPLLRELASRTNNETDFQRVVLNALNFAIATQPKFSGPEKSQNSQPVSTQAHTPVTTQVHTPVTTEAGSQASITDQKLSDDLDSLSWRQNSKKTGWNADWLAVAEMTRGALASRMLNGKKNTWQFGMYWYSRFTPDSGRELLCRFPLKAQETKKT
jgi:hypothetical protein